MQNATNKAEELANAIKRCERTKIGKVIKQSQSSKLRWAHICAHSRIPVNSLAAKSVPAGTKNSRSEGCLLAKHLQHTAHKHHHHDGAIFPSSAMVLLDERTPPPGTSASAEGVEQGRLQMV
jgi:hypothetical protein